MAARPGELNQSHDCSLLHLILCVNQWGVAQVLGPAGSVVGPGCVPGTTWVLVVEALVAVAAMPVAEPVVGPCLVLVQGCSACRVLPGGVLALL